MNTMKNIVYNVYKSLIETMADSENTHSELNLQWSIQLRFQKSRRINYEVRLNNMRHEYVEKRDTHLLRDLLSAPFRKDITAPPTADGHDPVCSTCPPRQPASGLTGESG